jgi:hypothetical protein
MDLLINYGTTASAGGQPVIAEIELNQTKTAATTTFYDSYPGGNVIGTTNGTEVAGSGTTPYNITFVDGSIFDLENTGNIQSDSFWIRTNKINIINNSINFNSANASMILFWQDNTYIGFYGKAGAGFRKLGDMSNWTIPANANIFALANVKLTGNVWSSSLSPDNFTSFTASYNTVYLQIDPPTGKRIKQIALKGL